MNEIVLDHIQLTPKNVLRLAGNFSEEVGTCLFYSGGSFETSRRSFLCLFPYERIWVKDRKVWQQRSCENAVCSYDAIDPWEGLIDVMTPSNPNCSLPEWVGYFGYEMGAFSDREVQLQYVPASIPDAYFMRPAFVLALDHKSCTGTLLARMGEQPHLPSHQQQWLDRLTCRKEWPALLSELSKTDSQKCEKRLTFAKPVESADTYSQKIEIAKELIRSGDIYQVNLSQEFLLKGESQPFTIFDKLVSINPAPFTAFLRFPHFAIISSSPERFLSKMGNILETRPIKGTAPRGKTQEEDLQNKEELLSSPKERAELLMITDLMRNDLGKVSLPGSVITEKIWHCEAYTNVYHLLSVIHSQAIPDMHFLEIIRSCFPGGSITGCPKLRAMQVINALEKRSRGIYTGSIGYVAGNGDFDFNIAIRTLAWTEDSLSIQLGGAIVADSDPQKEYEETLHKGASIFRALGMPSQHERRAIAL